MKDFVFPKSMAANIKLATIVRDAVQVTIELMEVNVPKTAHYISDTFYLYYILLTYSNLIYII